MDPLSRHKHIGYTSRRSENTAKSNNPNFPVHHAAGMMNEDIVRGTEDDEPPRRSTAQGYCAARRSTYAISKGPYPSETFKDVSMEHNTYYLLNTKSKESESRLVPSLFEYGSEFILADESDTSLGAEGSVRYQYATLRASNP